MKNFVMAGETLQLVAPYQRNAGDAALIGNIFGVAVDDVANGANGVFCTEGVFTVPKNVTQAITQGQRVFWDNAAKNITTTSAGNVCVGLAVTAQLAADTTVQVLLEPSTPAGT